MHIRKYDFDYGRRKMMRNMSLGLGAGVLMPLEKVLAEQMDLQKAYPDEVFSIEEQTKGKVSVGDTVDANNVEHVKHLLDPVVYKQISEMGRKIRIKEPTRDITTMYNGEFYEKTVKNLENGVKAQFAGDGNVVMPDGSPWKGGMPFPNPKNGIETQANMAMSWGRADFNMYAIKEHDIDPGGEKSYEYDFAWIELQTQSRMDGSVFMGKDDLLRYQTVYFTKSPDVAGTSFMSIWYYDQNKFPELYGYLPQFRRVRQFPTNQRFEPLIPGVTWFLTDPWAAGDPMLTWGDYKIIDRKPMLGAYNGNFNGASHENWELPVHGGPKGQTFYTVDFELSPEVYTLESKPVKYPRSPVGKRHAYIDPRNCSYCGNIRFDRQGKPWVSFETGFGQYKDGDHVVHGADGKTPAWSWTYVMSYDMQNGRMSRADHTKEAYGGLKSVFKADEEEMYNTYFTQQALQALGRV